MQAFRPAVSGRPKGLHYIRSDFFTGSSGERGLVAKEPAEKRRAPERLQEIRRSGGISLFRTGSLGLLTSYEVACGGCAAKRRSAAGLGRMREPSATDVVHASDRSGRAERPAAQAARHISSREASYPPDLLLTVDPVAA